jgi:hypothetical protein
LTLSSLARIGLVALLTSCAMPAVTRDGQLVFTEPGGRRGASVITANGVEFLDESSLPSPITRRSASEPWRAPTGFLLPTDGVWRETSTPVALQGRGLGILLRASDTLVPSWGGEILVRIDAVVPSLAFPEAAASLRAPTRLAIVVDGRGAEVEALARAALDNLGGLDRVALIDSSPARAILPFVPGSHRTLVDAAAQRVAAGSVGARELTRAVHLAARGLGAAPTAHVLVVTDGRGAGDGGLAAELDALSRRGVRVTAVATDDALAPAALAVFGDDAWVGGTLADRQDVVMHAIPPPGDVVLSDVVLTVASAPAPSHVLEVSGGHAELTLDSDRIELGDLYAGEARTEVLRIGVPAWVAGEPLQLTVTASYTHRTTGDQLGARAVIECEYSSEVERIATRRHGDVIAYASGLAMVRRLDRAFAGSRTERVGGLRPVVAWQARSLAELGRMTHDRALTDQAEVLVTLLGALTD